MVYRTDMKRSQIVQGILVGVLVLGALWVSIAFEPELRTLSQSAGLVGPIAYTLLTALAIVAAPISTLPLLPMASMLWGWIPAALLSVLGWTLGGTLAFLVGRAYGRPLVERFVSKERIAAFEAKIPEHRLFWSLIILRMITPVDVLSYALGIVARISLSLFIVTTALGTLPFALLFAYAGVLPLQLQLLAGVCGLTVLTLLWVRVLRR